MMMKHCYTLIALIILFLTSCNSSINKENKRDVFAEIHKQRNEVENLPTEGWMKDGFIDSSQILLTNEYSLSHQVTSGASSFLIQSQNDTFLCTAKHLLGAAMGISPSVDPRSFDKSLNYWLAYPRTNKISNDTILVEKMVTNKHSSEDIILLRIQKRFNSNIVPLKPRFSPVLTNEELTIIGCEYSDYSCHQKLYKGIATTSFIKAIIIEMEDTVNISGFSGAPVIDNNGYVVGIAVRSSYKKNVIVAEPINLIESWLK